MRKNVYTIEDLRKYAEDHNGVLLSKEYNKPTDKYKFKCNVCGRIWESVWYNMYRHKTWCIVCARIKYMAKSEKDLNFKLKKLNSKIKTVKLNVDAKEACKIVACRPAQKLLKFVCKDRFYLKYEEVKPVLINIEKIMYKRNIFRKPSVVVALALYKCYDISQTEASDITGTTSVSLRTLRDLLG